MVCSEKVPAEKKSKYAVAETGSICEPAHCLPEPWLRSVCSPVLLNQK